MHRHGYKGRKFHRKTDQRSALISGLAEALVINESIETTLPKAKELKPYIEKLITKAKKGDLHNRRQIITSLQTISSSNKLVDEIAPKMKSRNSGHVRIERTTLRRGDSAQMAKISFIFDESTKEEKTVKAAKEEQTTSSKATEKKSKSTTTATTSKKSTPKKEVKK